MAGVGGLAASAERLVEVDYGLGFGKFAVELRHLCREQARLRCQYFEVGGAGSGEKLFGVVFGFFEVVDLLGEQYAFLIVLVVGGQCVRHLGGSAEQRVPEGVERLLLTCLGCFETCDVLTAREDRPPVCRQAMRTSRRDS